MVALPLLVDVPVVFPRGGGVTLTLPVVPAMSAFVVFADRCIDIGGRAEVQEPRPTPAPSCGRFGNGRPTVASEKISGIHHRTVAQR